MLIGYFIVVLILMTGACLSVIGGKLTPTAGVVGFIIGLLVFVGAGYTGIAMLAGFFILATIATSVGSRTKHEQGLAEKNHGKRTAGQVVANAGVAAIMGLLVIALPDKAALFQSMLAASLASATADTLSSELGNVYGKSFYNILTFKKEKRGPDGVVSLEGTLFGVAGSICIAVIYAIGFSFNTKFYLIVVAGTVGNVFDSILGATLERKHYLDNNAVNFFNTLIAAIVLYLLY